MLLKMGGKPMNELLLELLSEEIPAKMQINAANQLLSLLKEKLQTLGLNHLITENFVTPRRITLFITGLPNEIPAKMIEKKGPKIDARPEAIEGFLKAVKMQLSELEVIDGFYYAKKMENAHKIEDSLKSIIEQILISFTWPKSMRSSQSNIRWVRPLKNILCLFNNTVIPINFGHLIANNQTYGHRFMAPALLTISSYQDYKDKMQKNYVILSSDERKNIILKQIEKIAANLKLNAVLDPGLLNEVVGLVEYPNILLGKIDAEFTHLPKEVLITAMKVHQRYFYLENDQGEIAPYFLTAANVKLDDDSLIIAGNEKVLKARLSDAKFFYEKDLKFPSSEALAKLARMTFHSKLGTMFDKTTRIIKLTEFLVNKLPINIVIAKKAALLCKTDLVSEMVGEFPELQGIMGKYYVLESGQEPEVALAIAEHYRPVDAEDIGNISLLGSIISIADKLDTIIGLWLAGEKPTSSKDPFAIRRSTLGIIKLIRYHNFDYSLTSLIEEAASGYNLEFSATIKQEIVSFFNDRLKYYFKAEGFRHDLIMASLYNNSDNIAEANYNLQNLQDFIKNPQSDKLLLAIKRISNILINESPTLEVNLDLLQPIELKLYNKVQNSTATLENLNSLVDDINQFFDKIMINDSDLTLKQNRLNLLYNIANISNKIADFSLIES